MQKKHTDLLQDDSFIRWRLFPTGELDNYWNKKIEEYPYLYEEILIADRYLQGKYFKRDKLTPFERDNIIDNIKKSITDNTMPDRKQISMNRWLKYVAIFIVVVSTSLVLSIILQKISVTDTETQDNIVGSIHEESDIQISIGDKIITYNQDIDVVLNNNGEVRINNEVINDKKDEYVMSKIVVPHGKRSKITLSDNSVLWINSGTIIEFPSKFSTEYREIILSVGECFIDVTPETSRPFFVNTNKMKIMVHGTSFNVSAYKEEQQSVVLLEGSVSIVTNSNTSPVYINPNEQALLTDDSRITTQKVDAELFTSWRNGYLLFNNTSMTDVLIKLEKYYNLSFDYNSSKEIKNIKCNGKLILSDNIDNVLKTISIITSTDYSVDDKTILITNKIIENKN